MIIQHAQFAILITLLYCRNMARGLDNLAEANIFPSVGQGHGNMNYLGDLNVVDILGKPADSVQGLSFETAHVFEFVDKGEEQTLELRFDGEPLRAERFLSLLQATAPTPMSYAHPDKRAGWILGHWAMHEGKAPTPYLEELATAYSGLEAWTQVGKEYPDLKAALEPADSFRLSPWMMPGNERIIKPADFIQSWGTAEGLANHDPVIRGPEFVQLLTDVYGADEARTRVIEAMRHVDTGKAQKEGLNLAGLEHDDLLRLFTELDIEARNRLVSVSDIQGTYEGDTGRSWSQSAETDKFTELYLERHCVTFETEEGMLMYAHGIAPDFDIDQAYAERQRIYRGSDRPRVHAFDRGMAYEYELMEVDTLIGKQSVIIPGSVDFQELGLIPAVRWSVGADGKRTRQDLPEHEALSSYKERVLSNVSGYMVLAYLQPQRRSHWMKETRLPGIEDLQEMGPAQVPLIALQQASRLLDNPLIQEAESLADPV